jgi:hypothetical protein
MKPTVSHGTWLGALVALGGGAGQFLAFLPDNRPAGALIGMGLVALITGATLGALSARLWPALCVAGAWGSVAAGAVVWRASGGAWAAWTVAVPLGAILAGGLIGALARKRFVSP